MGDLTSFRRASPRATSRDDSRGGKVAPARQAESSSWREAARGLGALLLVAPAAVFSAILLADGVPQLRASPEVSYAGDSGALVQEQFAPCIGSARYTCVVDGDTIWLKGEKIRVADIDAPEISRPRCEAERAAGMRATARLTAWLNAGPFEVHPNPDGRDEDRYGRKLRVLARGGTSAVEPLVAEGLATRWGEARRAWC